MPDLNQSPTEALSDDFALELGTPAVTTTTTETKQSEEKQVPEKYRGKSVDDLIEMHANAERRMSQMGNELGEVRRLADQLIGVKKTETTARQASPPKPITVEALLDNPDRVLEQKLSESSVAQRADLAVQKIDQMEAHLAQRSFVSKFPTFQEDMQNPDFIAWVGKNDLRKNLAAQAYNQNFDAATNLWSLWDEYKEVAGTANAAGASKAKQKMEQARTTKQGSAEASPAKTYSREKLMALRARVQNGDEQAIATWNNDAFQASLIQAYADGRVK